MSSKMEVDEKDFGDEEKGGSENNAEQKKITIEWSDFDVNDYASRYKGKVKIDRLVHIAQVNAPVAARAYELAVDEVRKGIDVQLYDRVCDAAQKVLGETKVPIDAAWMSTTAQENDQKTRQLEDEIQRWRNLSNREKICNAYIEAGQFYARTGSYTTAISRLIEAKSYAGDARMLFDINFRIITCSVQSGNLTHVRSEASHALSSEEVFTDTKKRSKAQAAMGLSFLRQGRYDSAVNHFIECDYSLHGQWPEALSGHDIALYGGLCALASFSRISLKKKVLDSEHFKRFLELRPSVAKLIRGFYDNEYGIVMSGLNDLKKELVVDMYLYSNVESLLTAIRGKALVQYFSPYSAMDMKKMAKAFNVSLPEMEQELSTCVSDGHIQAKIDSHSKIVYASLQNKRNKLFEEVLQVGNEFATEMKGVLLRMSLQEHGVIVSQTREMLMEMEMMGEDDGKGGLMGAMAGMGRRVLGFGPMGMGMGQGGPRDRRGSGGRSGGGGRRGI